MRHRISLLLFFAALLAPCREGNERLTDSLFKDHFRYAGAEPKREFLDEPRDLHDVPPVPDHPLEIPTKLSPERQYVFVCTRPCPVVELATEILPRRLASIGATSVIFPQSAREMAYPFIGGPVFVIRFVWKEQRFLIRNSPNHKFFLQVDGP